MFLVPKHLWPGADGLVRRRGTCAVATVYEVSIAVPLDGLADEIGRWGFCYLLTVSDDHRPHLLALSPQVRESAGSVTLRLDAGGGRACRNAEARPDVTLVFPPVEDSNGMSLVVDGAAQVDGPHIDLTPTWAVLHRPAP
jgi:hypothetical protein